MTSPQHKRKEDDAKSLTERVNELQQEVEYLQGELVNAAERIDQLQRKNDERKTKAHATIRSLKYVLWVHREVLNRIRKVWKKAKRRKKIKKNKLGLDKEKAIDNPTVSCELSGGSL